MKKSVKIIAGIIFAIVLSLSITGCASLERWGKDISSDVGGGLSRTVEVYDYSGNLIKTYSGKIDIESNANEENKVKFDVDDKRYIIYNAIVIVEEQ